MKKRRFYSASAIVVLAGLLIASFQNCSGDFMPSRSLSSASRLNPQGREIVPDPQPDTQPDPQTDEPAPDAPAESGTSQLAPDTAGDINDLSCAGTGVVQLDVDFAKATPTESMVGFLHGETAPAQYVTPLKPAYWRVVDSGYSKVKAMVPSAKVVTATEHEYNRKGMGQPWQNPSAYEAHAGDWAKANLSKDIVVDSINEPDQAQFWSGTRDQAFDAYLRMARAVRANWPLDMNRWPYGALGGPNTGSYKNEWVNGLADFCLARGCEINIFMWHFADPWQTRSQIETVNSEIIQNPKYAALKSKGVLITEFMGPDEQYDPSSSLAHFFHMEKAGAMGAMKGCWDDPVGKYNNCYNGTLDGLLTGDTKQPRSIWHLWKFYADGVSSRVYGETSSQYIPVIASRYSDEKDQPKAAQVLVSHYATQWQKPAAVKITLSLKNLRSLAAYKGKTSATLRIEQLANTPAVQPAQFVKEQRVNLASDVRICLPSLEHRNTFRLRLLP